MALPKLTQPELVEELAEETGWSKSDVRRFLDGLYNVIENNMREGYRVQVAGVLIEPKLRAAMKKRKGRNPRTGEEVQIKARPASVVLKAKPVAPLTKVELPSVKKLQNLAA
jgi:nucleoid DNA-binding protein